MYHVASIVRRLFLLPRVDDLIHIDLEFSFVEKMVRRMLEPSTPHAPTLKRTWFRPKYKLMVLNSYTIFETYRFM